MRILAMDYGEKRVGLALSDPLGFTAQGLETLLNRGSKAVIAEIVKICRERQVTDIVIGLPINMNGSYGPKADEILKLVPRLESETGASVKTWDERLTSRQADRLMIEEGLSRRKQKQNSDELAAILILQSYLESRRK